MFDKIKEPKLPAAKRKRSKQKLEGLLSSSIKNTPNIIGHKIQSNKLSHQPTHCDFEIFNQSGKVFFIEAKECKLNKNGYGSFAFSRLTQKNALSFYDSFSTHTQSVLLLFFRSHFLKDSQCYAIPIDVWNNFEYNHCKKSINNTEASNLFRQYQISFINELMDLTRFC